MYISKFISTALLSLCLSSMAWAQDKPLQENKKDIRLKPIVVTSSPYQNREDIPASVYRIDANDLHHYLQATSIPDALREIPGIYIQKTAPGRATPIIRGFTSSRNVVIADGVRVNNPILREGPNEYWNTLDPYTYENIEVIMGSGSVLYGSDAAGGVVLLGSQALTQGEVGDGLQHQGSDLYLQYSSAQSSFSQHVDTELSYEDQLSFSFGLTRQDYGNLRTGDGHEDQFTAYDEWATNFRLEYFLNDQSSLLAGYDYYYADDINRSHKTVHSNSWKGTTVGKDGRRSTDFKRSAAFLGYQYREGQGLISEADIRFSVQDMQEDYQRFRTNGALRQDKDWQDTTYGLTTKLVSETDIGKLSYGFDYYYDDVNSQGWDDSNGTLVQGKVADDASYQQFGIYLQDEITATDRLTFIAGLRYSYIKLNANEVKTVGQLSNNWTAWTGNLQAIYRLSDDNSTHAYVSLSQAFRAPNLSDTTRDDEFSTSGNEEPNANLDPEHFTTLETGIRVNKEDWSLQLAIYRTRVEDRIARLKTAGNNTKANLDEGYVQGIEIYADYDLTENLTAFGRIAWQEGYEDTYASYETTNPVNTDETSKMPPLNGETGLRWTNDNKKFFFEGSVVFADRQDHLSYGDVKDTSRIPADGTPGYAIYNLRSGYKFSDTVELAVALENLADTSYRIHGSGNNEPGRSITSTLHMSF